jgi:hypothetical protein
MMIIHKWNVSGTSQPSIMTIILILMIMTYDNNYYYDNGSGKNIVNNKNNPFINCIIIRSQNSFITNLALYPYMFYEYKKLKQNLRLI